MLDRLQTGLLLIVGLALTYLCGAVALGFVWAGSLTGVPPFAAAAYLVSVVVLPAVGFRRARGPRSLRVAAWTLLAINAFVLPVALTALVI